MPLQTLTQIRAAVPALADEGDVRVQSALDGLSMKMEQAYGRHYDDGSNITYTTMFKVSTVLLPRRASAIVSPVGSILSESGYLILPPEGTYMFDAGTSIVYTPYNDDKERVFALQRGIETLFSKPAGLDSFSEDTANVNTNSDTAWKVIADIMNVGRTMGIG